MAGLLVAVAAAGAIWLHGYKERRHIPYPKGTVGARMEERRALPPRYRRERPSWADPVAGGLVIAGITAGASVMVSPRKLH